MNKSPFRKWRKVSAEAGKKLATNVKEHLERASEIGTKTRCAAVYRNLKQFYLPSQVQKLSIYWWKKLY